MMADHSKNMQEFITQGGDTDLIEDSDDSSYDGETDTKMTSTVVDTDTSISQLL